MLGFLNEIFWLNGCWVKKDVNNFQE